MSRPNHARSAALIAVLAPFGPLQDDVPGVPSEERRIEDDANRRYFLHGAGPDAEAPEAGYRLLLVLPGGDGGADFQPFVKRIWKDALPPGYLVAQLVAPRWSEEQARDNVWPLEKRPAAGMEFSTEAFLEAVIADVERSHAVDPEHVFALGWSSSGPAVYASALAEDSRLTGAFVAMSVFKRGELPSLDAARDRAFYILHSPDDWIPIAMAKTAHDELRKKRARVRLVQYAGGHGWHGDVYAKIRAGVKWLESERVEEPGGQR